MFTSESLSLFRGLSLSFMFLCTTITCIFAYFRCIVIVTGAISMIFHTRFWKDWNCYGVKLHVKRTSFPTDNGQTSRLSIFYCVSNHKNFIPKYLDNADYIFCLNFTNIKATIGGKSSHKWFWKNSSQCRDILLQVK